MCKVVHVHQGALKRDVGSLQHNGCYAQRLIGWRCIECRVLSKQHTVRGQSSLRFQLRKHARRLSHLDQCPQLLPVASIGPNHENALALRVDARTSCAAAHLLVLGGSNAVLWGVVCLEGVLDDHTPCRQIDTVGQRRSGAQHHDGACRAALHHPTAQISAHRSVIPRHRRMLLFEQQHHYTPQKQGLRAAESEQPVMPASSLATDAGQRDTGKTVGGP